MIYKPTLVLPCVYAIFNVVMMMLCEQVILVLNTQLGVCGDKFDIEPINIGKTCYRLSDREEASKAK